MSLSAQDTLYLDPKHCAFDESLNILLCNSPIATINDQGPYSIVEYENDFFDNWLMPSQFELGRVHRLLDSDVEEVLLYFTELPVLEIHTDNVIVDEPRVLAQLNLQSSSGEALQSEIGIEYKGGWTQTLDKKSLRIEFWADSLGVETRKVSMLGMRSDDDWNLEAMFNEPLRIRNVTNARLWKALHEPYYIDREPEAKSAIEFRYVEVFINGQYQGVYALSERIDRKLLQIKKADDNRRGELFKAYSWGASTFGSVPDYDNLSSTWGGFDHIYPESSIEWGDLHGFIDFAINEWHDRFYEEWDERFERSNAVDYFIFLNAIRALDNTGKNIYVAKYDEGEPYFYVPFDLDGTYGLVWNGEISNATDGILSNGFYDRLLKDCNAAGFSTEMKVRWQALRQNLLSNDNLKNGGLSNYNFLKANGIYAREELAWSGYEFIEDNIDQFTSWIDVRMALLDSFFENLCEDVSTEQLRSNLLSLSGNISDGQLFLEGAELLGNYSCKVYNCIGELSFSSYNNPWINLSGYAAGNYQLLVEHKGGVNFHKIALVR